MRIVIDMQGAQTESRFRGIGRYTMSFAQALARNRGEHELILALNGLFPDTVESIRVAFDSQLPQENIRVWYSPGPVMEKHLENDTRRVVSELVREAFLVSLAPDIVHISSLFEGYIDDAVTSIGSFDRSTPVSVSLYDLIPLLNPDLHLRGNRRFAQYYQQKIGHLRRAAIYLAISEFSKHEVLEHLDECAGRVVNVSTAVESFFQPIAIDDAEATRLHQKIGITRPFVLYTGGADERKNLPRLIQAFAALPATLRDRHQLLLAGRIHSAPDLTKHAVKVGLNPDRLCFTGYVTDEELVKLYNLCKLFIFPSWHEGFGLPALEAMACGAPVIGANTSSLPEVIGLDDALFDPRDVESIKDKLSQALDDTTFRDTLRKHGLKQAKKFSWNESAKRAISKFELLHKNSKALDRSINRSGSMGNLTKAIARNLRSHNTDMLITLAACLARNQITGIERQLYLDVSELIQRDAATGVQRVVRSYLKALLQFPPAGFRVEPVYATQNKKYHYARCYSRTFLGQQAGSLSEEPIRWQRGDVFFGLDMQHHIQLEKKTFYQQLRRDGVTVKFLVYDLLPLQLKEMFNSSAICEMHAEWLKMIAETDGAICISRATADAYDAWMVENNIRRTPNFQLAWVHIGSDISSSKPTKGLPPDSANIFNILRCRPSFLCVATLEPRKAQHQIVAALQMMWEEGIDVNLVLVGREGWKTEALAEKIRNHPMKDKCLFWLQGISDEYLEQIYSTSTCLIAASVNEGFGLPIVEAARHQIPVIARDIPVFREVAGECAFYFNGESSRDLSTALKAWLVLYKEGRHPKSSLMKHSTWQESAETLKTLLVNENCRRRQLLVDVSELIQHDAKSGIQRVVRSILKEWLNNQPANYYVEPVYATVDKPYRYARQFTNGFLGRDDDHLIDEPVEYAPGDIFIGLDMNHHVPRVHEIFLRTMKRNGVRIWFVVYDLLPIQFPHFWEHQHSVHLVHQQWLHVITKFDGAVCISKAVADELDTWVKKNVVERKQHLKIDWFHLGADVDNSLPTEGLPTEAAKVLKRLCDRNSFLMVGTLEPRKGYEQVLDGFERLWGADQDQDVNLIIVGKPGWMVKKLITRIRTHPQLNRRLFWLDGISDEYLEKVYEASTCLIAASYGEGFGLPLIEAAQHRLPIIARAIPVFKEVAGEYAYYFEATDPESFTKVIRDWLRLYDAERHPKSINMPWIRWKNSAKQLCEIVLESND